MELKLKKQSVKYTDGAEHKLMDKEPSTYIHTISEEVESNADADVDAITVADVPTDRSIRKIIIDKSQDVEEDQTSHDDFNALIDEAVQLMEASKNSYKGDENILNAFNILSIHLFASGIKYYTHNEIDQIISLIYDQSASDVNFNALDKNMDLQCNV